MKKLLSIGSQGINQWYSSAKNVKDKIMTIADNRYLSYQNENDLVDFIASEMQKGGLDQNNEENLDSYLNTKIVSMFV